MDKLHYNGKTFTFYEYNSEDKFEKDVIEHSKEVFGPSSLYIDIKKKIGDEIVTIPDGYLIDFSFESQPKLYIVENELVTHDPYRHIGQQLLKFATAFKGSAMRIKKFLLNDILESKEKQEFVEKALEKTAYRNIDNFLEELVTQEVACIVIIDQNENNSPLENVLSQLRMKTDIIEFQTFICDEEHIHKFDPFLQDINFTSSGGTSQLQLDELNTIVVPANEEGFNEVFLGQNSWYSIRISSAMLDRIKYIAAYQTAPVSAITYLAEVSKIEKYQDSGKYIVYFKEKAKSVGPIKLTTKNKGAAPQAPRYTSIEKLLTAKTLEEVF